MPKKLITEQQVINVAKLLVMNGKTLTVAAVRMHLGTNGSDSTIHKYLKKWKEECFKKTIASIDQGTNKNDQLKITQVDEFLEEKSNLEKKLSSQINQNEHYAQELINAEKVNIALKEEIHQLQSATKNLQFELTEIKAVKNNLEQINEKIQNKLDINSNETILKMQQTIDDLRLELKTLNETSVAALRETSNQGHEILMQEKVAGINMQARIDSLTKELLESKKQLHEAIMTAQVQNRSLTRQNEELQKTIQEHGSDKLPILDQKLSLNLTQEATVYGK